MCLVWNVKKIPQLFGFLLIIVGGLQANHGSREYIVNGRGSKVLELVFDSSIQHRRVVGCTVSYTRSAISKKIPKMNYANTHVMNEKSLDLAVKACEHISSSMKGNTDESFTFPGTKWCGPGNTARNFNDLGPHHEADSCCRMHDFCPQTIPPGKTRFALHNPSPGIISHCDCDERLSKCLRANGERVSDIIGIMFFDMLQVQCFKQDTQKAKCDKSNESSFKSCQRQQENSTLSKQYKFFSAKPYKHAHDF